MVLSCMGTFQKKHEFFLVKRASTKNTLFNRQIKKGEPVMAYKLKKGVWGMPRLPEAKKDVISCEKLRGLAHTR